MKHNFEPNVTRNSWKNEASSCLQILQRHRCSSVSHLACNHPLQVRFCGVKKRRCERHVSFKMIVSVLQWPKSCRVTEMSVIRIRCQQQLLERQLVPGSTASPGSLGPHGSCLASCSLLRLTAAEPSTTPDCRVRKTAPASSRRHHYGSGSTPDCNNDKQGSMLWDQQITGLTLWSSVPGFRNLGNTLKNPPFFGG